jgi:hypothetical protein
MCARRWIIRRYGVRDGRTAHLQHCVVPRCSTAETLIHGLLLWVTEVVGVVSTAMTQVDAAHKRDVVRCGSPVTDDHQLLVMGSEPAHSLIQQDLSARLVELSPEPIVLLSAEGEVVGV